ncbi:hypothetical protein GGI25_004352 [Coemansia spiralis]|uniref:Zn(2)-C6 fungal-type domain-containing protein n=2 Tax=Coemansia TaxID=4863 RepID=A0A9W8G0J6_9FUNG|nr:fungal-specific transcription factor domain-containing protein [Coemansia spiralis]KAJ1992060.1 hypothetical protein EDC05_003051 [Coemansia umbellata]KAJ2621437.1 hypothetical protein GGI26_004119 [Coemansia sp. RSA 1358]KAJ2674412.1 hypothetical protein GGI25_004352 [Coemansia spiralis]
MDLGLFHRPVDAAAPDQAAQPKKPIGMACRACRQRKIRCGGERPRCSYCVKKGYECVLTPHKKRGRPRKDEQRGKRPNNEPEELDVGRLWAELTGLQSLELPPELSALAADSAIQPQDAMAQQMGLPHEAQLFANYAFPGLSGPGSASPAPPQQPSAQPDQSSDVSHPDNASLAHEPPPAPGAGASAGRPAAGDASSTQSGLRNDEGVHMYFVYVHPWLPLLHRPTFEQQIADGTVDPLLYYAVQAIAARFRTTSHRKPYRRGQRYARAARELLPAALRSARLSTLQAITILALYMSVSGRWQEGALYEKLAVQLLFIGQYHLLDEEFLLPPVANNMGLYETGWSEHSHPARLEVLSRPNGILEHEQRRRAWWSVFQLERFNGLAMGRPPIIKPGWHWVWLPCSEELWARDSPSGALAWEMGLADFAERPVASVSNCRVDLILSLLMGQIIEQRTEMFRLFFPRVDRGTLFYDNLPTHSCGWPVRLKRLQDTVATLERRMAQWHQELDRYADMFSARRHANFEIMGAACQIHLFACVLQIHEHLREDSEGASDHAGFMARAKRPEMTADFVRDLDELAERCWARSIEMADEIARLLRVHWLRAIGNSGAPLDAEVADRFKLMNPQTPYHLFVAGKVQAALLKKKQSAADRAVINQRLDDIIAALEYCQLFWFALNFASHLKYLKAEASAPS